MNRPLRRVATACLVMLFLLLGAVNYWQVVKADEYNEKPENRRALISEYSRQRGPIIVGETPIAYSEETDDQLRYLRVYENGPMYAPATGFYSPVFGRSGVERAENDYLAGTADAFFVDRLVDLVTNKQPEGGSVVLTLNPRAQEVAWEEMEGRQGAVVALDAETGEILALVASPSYDPNELATHDVAAADEAWQALNEDEDKPMENRPLARLYPPGSTFKVITAAAALSNGYTPETVVPGPGTLDLPLTTHDLSNFDGRPCGDNNETTLLNALRISCNTAFASIGLDLGDDVLREQAEAFGFGRDIDVPMQAATSRFPEDADEPQTALSAIGQFDVAETALQNAMVAAAVVNGGVVMKPHLVREILGPDLVRVEATEPERLSTAVSPEVAATLADMMVTVVEDGTGRNGAISGVRVGGKTGTAQRGEDEKPDAWFISFADTPDRKIAVAVVIENGAEDSSDISGGRLSAPVAKAVTEAVLGL